MPFAQNKNIVVAHRGAWKTQGLPENSIASLKRAIELGCAGSEFDVRMTADDSLIINHDAFYQGLNIEKNSYSVLSSKLLANGESLPTLQSYLQAGLTGNRGTRLVCEIKPSDMGNDRAMKIIEKVVTLVHKMHAQGRVNYISFDYNMLLAIKQKDKKATLQYLTGDKSPQQLKQDGISGCDYHYSVYEKNPGWIREAKSLGLIVNAWTVNEPAVMDSLLAQQVTFITTNEPEMLLTKEKNIQ